MSAWTQGYVSDIPYSLGFYRETTPAHIAFATLAVGKDPGPLLAPKRVLELGIGMGLGFVITAAGNPEIQFEGVDFNPLQIAHVQGLIDEAGLANVAVREASFQDVAREAAEGQHDVDLIILHGIFAWVSLETQDAIIEVARKRLRPGGLLYVSYNCMPGWAPMAPLQRLLREAAARAPNRSDLQVAAGIDLLKALNSEGAAYFKVNPSLEKRVEQLEPMDKTYLAHEYLNAHWAPMHFADVAEMFGRAKLGYVGSATLAENIDGLSVPEGLRGRMAAESDSIFKETLRDLAANKQFRRDLYARGVGTLKPAEHAPLMSGVRFVLAVARDKVTFKFSGPLGELDGKVEAYDPVADLIAEHPASVAEIASLSPFRQQGMGSALQTIALLVHSGQAMPLPASRGEREADGEPARRLNRVLLAKAQQGRGYNFIATPVAGSGLQARHSDLLLLGAILAGHAESQGPLTGHLIQGMERLGGNWVKEGKPVTERAERETMARADVIAFLSGTLPLWRRLGVL